MLLTVSSQHGKKVRRYNNGTVPFPWAGHFPMLKYKYIFFQIKYMEAILSNSSRRLLWFEITKMPIAVLKLNLLCHLL